MSFSYFDNDKKLQKVDIQVGTKWSDYNVKNETISSIFNEVDDGDGIVQLTEKAMLDNLVKQADSQIEKTANNNILEKDELDKFDVKTGVLKQTYDKNNFTLEKIKEAYPEDKYNYTEERSTTLIIDNATGKTVAKYYEIHDADRDLKFFEEYTNTNKEYYVYENHRNDESSISLSAPKNSGSQGFSLDFIQGGVLRSYRKDDLKLFGQAALTQQILLNNLDNPQWLKTEAIDFINNIPAEDLLKIVVEYNENNNNAYFLEKLNASKDIPKKEKEAFIANTLKRLDEALEYDPQKKVENSQVKTDFYQSQNTYSITYNDDKITIKQTGGKKKAKDQTIDLNKLLSDLPLDMRPFAKKSIQCLPGEALMDLAIEADRFDSPEHGQLLTNMQAGLFDPNKDKISIGYNRLTNAKPSVLSHELGHAIDCVNVKNGKKYTTKDSANFIKAYNNAVKQWNANPQPTDRIYLLKSPQEAFAELYTYSMYGSSNASVPETITPELLTEFQKLLESIREVKTDDRHKREK